MWRVSKIDAKSTLPPCLPAGQGKGDRPSKNDQGRGTRLKQARGCVVSPRVGRLTDCKEGSRLLCYKALSILIGESPTMGRQMKLTGPSGLLSGIDGCCSPSLAVAAAPAAAAAVMLFLVSGGLAFI